MTFTTQKQLVHADWIVLQQDLFLAKMTVEVMTNV